MGTKDGQKYYLHYNQVGSLRAVSDTNGNVVKEIAYDTYGNIRSDSNPDFKVPFGFAGGLYDRDTGLVHFGYREYDAFTGKWTAKDPIGFDGGDSNLYGYVLGDPVRGFDPFGLKMELCKTGNGNELFYHQFWIINNSSIGFYPRNDPEYLPQEGRYLSDDPHEYDKDLSCEVYPDNTPDKCIEQCILDYAKQKAPKYWAFGHQCRVESRDMYTKCFQKCWSRK